MSIRSRNRIAGSASITLALGLLLTGCSNGSPTPEPGISPMNPSSGSSPSMVPPEDLPEEIVGQDETLESYVANELLVRMKDGASVQQFLSEVAGKEKAFLADEDQKTGQFKIILERNPSLAELKSLREEWSKSDLVEEVQLNHWY